MLACRLDQLEQIVVVGGRPFERHWRLAMSRLTGSSPIGRIAVSGSVRAWLVVIEQVTIPGVPSVHRGKPHLDLRADDRRAVDRDP
jgi:hypothetical protein